jgi:hypothetical protein
VLPDHEALAVPVDQVRPGAAQRLGHQRLLRRVAGRAEVQRGRVELDELDVGHRRPGPQRQRDPVAGRHHRVGRGPVDLAHPAGGEHHGTGEDGAHPVLRTLAEHVQGHPGGPAGGVGEQVEDQCVLDEPDPRVAPYRRVQRPLHLGTGGVPAGVHDPVGVVPAFAAEHQRAVRVPVELRAEAHQLPYPRRSFGHQHLDGGRVA